MGGGGGGEEMWKGSYAMVQLQPSRISGSTLPLAQRLLGVLGRTAGRLLILYGELARGKILPICAVLHLVKALITTTCFDPHPRPVNKADSLSSFSR